MYSSTVCVKRTYIDYYDDSMHNLNFATTIQNIWVYIDICEIQYDFSHFIDVVHKINVC